MFTACSAKGYEVVALSTMTVKCVASSRVVLRLILAGLFCSITSAMAQFSSHFAVTNVGFSMFCSGTNGTYAYYYGSATASTNGQISLTGSRLSVPEGPEFGVPSISNAVASVPQRSNLQGPAWYNTNATVFTQRIGGRFLTLTNEHISETVFPVVQLTDGAIIKGFWSFNVERRQRANIVRGTTNYSWTTNRTWFAGQAFLSVSNMTGVIQLGE